MYKPPIELVMEEVFQKMNEDFENSIFKAIQKVGINVDKEELLKALIYDRGQYDKGYEDAMNEVKHPQPLKFEDLAPGMWVMDMWTRTISRIKRIDENRSVCLNVQEEYDYITPFGENRFYPITLAFGGE